MRLKLWNDLCSICLLISLPAVSLVLVPPSCWHSKYLSLSLLSFHPSSPINSKAMLPYTHWLSASSIASAGSRPSIPPALPALPATAENQHSPLISILHHKKAKPIQTYQSQSSYFTGNKTYLGHSLTVTPALLKLELVLDFVSLLFSDSAYMAALWALQIIIVVPIISWV